MQITMFYSQPISMPQRTIHKCTTKETKTKYLNKKNQFIQSTLRDELVFLIKSYKDPSEVLERRSFEIGLINTRTNKFYTVHVDLHREMEQAWADCMVEEKKHDDEVKRINNRIFRAIESTLGKKFLKDLMECIKEIEVSDMKHFEIVRKTSGNYQEEDYDSIKGIWVDQWHNGGYEGDDFAGDIYVELKKDRFLKMYYAC